MKAGKTVLVAAHGNSLRSIVMHLDRLSREEVLELNLGTGVPIVYDIDAEGRVQGKRIL
jgi:2,3-bisphosphoglycerate-dependent phosphoglycerate mutase